MIMTGRTLRRILRGVGVDLTGQPKPTAGHPVTIALPDGDVCTVATRGSLYEVTFCHAPKSAIMVQAARAAGVDVVTVGLSR